MTSQARIAIAGGGPAGSAAAISLARLGLSVDVFESARGPQNKPGECLGAQSTPLIHHLGLADRLARGPHLRGQGNWSLWGGAAPLERNQISHPHGATWRLDRRAFEEALALEAQATGVRWHYGARIRHAERRKGSWTLAIQDSGSISEITADFIIDASGRRAGLIRKFGAQPVALDRLACVLAELAPSGETRMTDTYTTVEAVRSGWWYSALLPNGKLTVLFMTDHDLPQFRAAIDPRQWRAMLRETTRLSAQVEQYGFHEVVSLRVVAAASCRMSAICGDGWLAAGDAAAAFDPLSSHGIAAALGSGYYAGRAACDVLSGCKHAVPAYLALMQQAWDAYSLEYSLTYSAERRWPNEIFWQRRHAPLRNASR